MTRVDKLYDLGQTLGVTKDEIKSTLRRRRNQILLAVVPVMAFAFAATTIRVFGVRYGGISIEDFRIFRILRLIFGL